MPFFSIITITRNHRFGLKSTANSILSQTHQDYEWLIIDGASTDGTTEDLENYPEARIISEPDAGIYDAMNKGIHHAIGDYIIFMNAGDQFADSGVLETIFDRLQSFCSSPPDLIYGDSWESGHYKPARSAKTILWGMFTHHQSILYRRSALAILRYSLEYKIAADYDLTFRFLKIHPTTLYIPRPICIFETGGVSQQHVKRGRMEQYLSRSNNKACSRIINGLILFLQTLMWNLRSRIPRFYWIIRQLLRSGRNP